MDTLCGGLSWAEDTQLFSDGQGFYQHEISRQLPTNPHRPVRTYSSVTAGPMRVVKPKSASNSPRDAMGLSRRRSVLNENSSRRRLAVAEQQAMPSSTTRPKMQCSSSNRPVSWHPSSTYLAAQACSQSSLYPPPVNPFGGCPTLDTSPSLAAHSAYNSPASAISTFSLPYTDYSSSTDPPLFNQFSNTYYHANHHVPMNSTPSATSTQNRDSILGTHFDWNQFLANGFTPMDPPTPDYLIPVQHPSPVVTTDEALPYQSLADEEDAGEELVGLGLYDKVAKQTINTHLNPYQSLMASDVLGSLYDTMQPKGKGLKLEETWVPPADEKEPNNGGEDETFQGKQEQTPTVQSNASSDQSYWLSHRVQDRHSTYGAPTYDGVAQFFQRALS